MAESSLAESILARLRLRQSPKKVGDGEENVLAMFEAIELGLAPVLDLLGVPDDVRGVVSAAELYRAYQNGSSSQPDAALAELDQLYLQLSDENFDVLEIRRGFGLGRRAVEVGVLAAAATLLAAPLSALAVGEPLAKEVVKSGIASLITAIFAQAVDLKLNDSDGARTDPVTAMMRAHQGLVEAAQTYRVEVEQLDPARPGGPSLAQTRLLAAIGRAQLACIAVRRWPDRVKYLRRLSQLILSLVRSAEDSVDKYLQQIERTRIEDETGRRQRGGDHAPTRPTRPERRETTYLRTPPDDEPSGTPRRPAQSSPSSPEPSQVGPDVFPRDGRTSLADCTKPPPARADPSDVSSREWEQRPRWRSFDR